MNIGLLGPLEVSRFGVDVTPSAPKLRKTLALLALNANQIVHTAQLLEELWEHDPPASASTTLQTYVYQLRKSLAPPRDRGESTDTPDAVLLTRRNGYLLRLVRGSSTDVQQFESMLDRAREELDSDSLQQASETARGALALWRGTALGGVALGPLLAARAAQLEESRNAGLELRFDAELRLGHHARMVEELAGVVRANPTHEGYSAKLMIALHRCSRRAEALEIYHRLRAEFVAQLGLEPSTALRQLHQQVLADSPELGRVPPTPLAVLEPVPTDDRTPPARYTGPSARRPVPASPVEPRPTLAQLPPDVPAFVGRESGRRHLVDLCESVRNNRTGGSRVVEITGAPGSGKSAFLVHVAHAVREFFPDGQLYLDLGPVSRGELSLPEVLASCLRACGVPLEGGTGSLIDLAHAFRGFTADRQLLVVADDVTSNAQLDQLRPSGTACLLLTTSRRWLHPRGGDTAVQLPLLTMKHSLQMLGNLAGEQRLRDDPTCATTLAGLSQRLPVALNGIGSWLAYRPGWTLQRMRDRLVADPEALLRIPSGDAQVGDSVLASYRVFDEPVRRALRLLAVDRGPTIDVARAELVLGVSTQVAEETLEALSSAHLLTEVATDGSAVRPRWPDGDRLVPAEPTYQMPELVRLFGRRLAAGTGGGARDDGSRPAGEVLEGATFIV